MAERTESSITIDATPVEVLHVIGDLESYPQWAGGITQVQVLDSNKDGRPVRAQLTMSSGPIRDSLLVGYQWTVRKDGTGTVSWALEEPGRVTSVMDGSYEIMAVGTGTQVTYRLEVDVTMPMPGLLRRKAEKVIIQTALNDLKKRAEA